MLRLRLYASLAPGKQSGREGYFGRIFEILSTIDEETGSAVNY
jgi:hypothetical protein